MEEIASYLGRVKFFSGINGPFLAYKFWIMFIFKFNNLFLTGKGCVNDSDFFSA